MNHAGRNENEAVMSIFTHIILTRFNLRMGYGGGVLQDAAWHHHRFDLFEKFCLPSIRGQNNTAFRWIVFFDRQTANVFKQKIAVYAQWDNFIPYYVDGLAQSRDQAILEQVQPGSKYLITTRLDNDDALSKDFIAKE